MISPPVTHRRLVIFARAPEHGRVKTRLAADVGPEAALKIYRWLGARTLAASRAVHACDVEVCFTPPDARDAVVHWLGDDLRLRPQSDGDLGARMHAALASAVSDGMSAVVIVGTDCPALDTAVLERAFDALAFADVVLGPATDGGYYLIAVRTPHAVLFDDIPWSSPHTLARTVAAAASAGLVVTLLEALPDVDTAADWQQWLKRAATSGDGATT